MEEETIYNLIPREYIPPAKERPYKSKFPKNIPPTASTFIHHTTSIPKVSNYNGDFEKPPGPHKYSHPHATLGLPMEKVKPKTS